MLKVSHDAFEGSYTMFHHWREGLEELSSIHVDPLSYSNENYEGVWRRDPVEPLIVLLVHADAYGRIPARFTQSLADRLQGLMEDMDPTDQPDPPDLRGPADWDPG